MKKETKTMYEIGREIVEDLENSGIEILSECFSETTVINSYLNLNNFMDIEDFLHRVEHEKEKLEKTKAEWANQWAWDDYKTDLDYWDDEIRERVGQYKALADKIEELLLNKIKKEK